jgi:hypothetical protein
VKLYHFTALEYLGSILDEGLTRGDVPLSPTRRKTAIWLTRNPDPDTQAWTGDPRRERKPYARLLDFAPSLRRLPRFVDKRAVMLAVEVPDGDGKLVGWLCFAAQRGIDRRWVETVARARGGKMSNALDWYIYRGAIPREWIVDVVPLSEEATRIMEAKRLRAW